MYEEFETGNINIENAVNWFEDEEIINYLSGIMVSDFEITDIEKSINDIIFAYNKENLLNERNEILKQLEDAKNISKDEIDKLENRLNEVIINLAKMK